MYNVWTTDEPEFLDGAEYKFHILSSVVDIAMGTGGKNDHLGKETISYLADWALSKLLVACVKVALWCGYEFIRRKAKRLVNLFHLSVQFGQISEIN